MPKEEACLLDQDPDKPILLFKKPDDPENYIETEPIQGLKQWILKGHLIEAHPETLLD